MRQSLIVVAAFVIGCAAGKAGGLHWDLHGLSLVILYALMFQIGLSVGCSDNLKAILRNFRPKMLLLPLATLTGTLALSALTAFALTRWTVFDCMVVGSGMGYYSLSSILVTQLKLPTLGEQLAAELGTVALLSNIFRELLSVVCAPLFRRSSTFRAGVCAAGVTSVDVCLPTVARVSGKEMIPVSLFHGMALDMTVPVIGAFICSL